MKILLESYPSGFQTELKDLTDSQLMDVRDAVEAHLETRNVKYKELKPCPFCGDVPSLEGNNLKHITKRCLMGSVDITFHSREQAIESWNERHGVDSEL